MNPFEAFPLPIIILDYILGTIMWTLIGRGVLDFFIAPDKNFVIAKVFRDLTNPIIKLFKKITPSFLLPLMIPFYVAWWFFIIRFYLLPYIFFGEMGVLSFPI